MLDGIDRISKESVLYPHVTEVCLHIATQTKMIWQKLHSASTSTVPRSKHFFPKECVGS